MTSTLSRRIASAAVLAPLAVAAAIAGPPWFTMMVGLCGAAMAWEWARLCAGAAADRSLVAVPVVLAIGACVAAALAGPVAGLLVALAAGLVVAIIQRHPIGRAVLAGAGMAYMLAALVAIIALRGQAAAGYWPVLWLFAVVWAVDIAAYAAGRSIGGPRLAPTVSPSKTWSGLAGGAIAAALTGWAVALAAGAARPVAAAALALLLAIVAQIGDLAESAAKRYFGVKDASALIPGHGGVLDRLDGLMAAALALALLRYWVGEDITGWQ